jgi:hypothetical protein
MKNISERENPDQFAGFHEMLHELAETELKGTQFIFRIVAGTSDLVAAFRGRSSG